MATCTATKADGAPCLSQARSGRQFCIAHDPEPDSQVARQAAAYRGGKRSKPTPKTLDIGEPKTAEEIASALSLIASKVASGDFDPRRGQVAAQALKTQLTALGLAERIADVEKQLAALERRKGLV